MKRKSSAEAAAAFIALRQRHKLRRKTWTPTPVVAHRVAVRCVQDMWPKPAKMITTPVGELLAEMFGWLP